VRDEAGLEDVREDGGLAEDEVAEDELAEDELAEDEQPLRVLLLLLPALPQQGTDQLPTHSLASK